MESSTVTSGTSCCRRSGIDEALEKARSYRMDYAMLQENGHPDGCEYMQQFVLPVWKMMSIEEIK